MRLIIGKKPCFWGFMGKEWHFDIVKEQTSPIHAPAFEKKMVPRQNPSAFFFSAFIFF